MSPGDSDSDDSEHSNGGSADGDSGLESQPRDPETGQFLPKDERDGSERTVSDETAIDGAEAESGEADATPRSRSDRAVESGARETEWSVARPTDDDGTATGRRGERPREPPEQRPLRASPMRLYTIPSTHPIAPAATGPTASAEGRDLPPALDLVTLQVRRDGWPVLRHSTEAANPSRTRQSVPNPRTRPPAEAVRQAPPAGAEPRRSSGATADHPSTSDSESTVATSTRPNTGRPTDTRPEAAASRGRRRGRGEPGSTRPGGPRW